MDESRICQPRTNEIRNLIKINCMVKKKKNIIITINLIKIITKLIITRIIRTLIIKQRSIIKRSTIIIT